MAAGIIPKLWTLERFYDEVTAHERELKKLAATRRLMERLRRPE